MKMKEKKEDVSDNFLNVIENKNEIIMKVRLFFYLSDYIVFLIISNLFRYVERGFYH